MSRQSYEARVPLHTPNVVLEFFRRQAGARCSGRAIDQAIAWITSDQNRLAAYRAFCEAQHTDPR